MPLSDRQQGEIMLVAFILVPIAAWLGIGAPTAHTDLAALGSAIIMGVLLYFKEALGVNVPTSTQQEQTSTPTAATATPTKTSMVVLHLKKRLAFLQLRK